MCVCIGGYVGVCAQSHVTKGSICQFSLAEMKLWPLCAVVDILKAWQVLRVASYS